MRVGRLVVDMVPFAAGLWEVVEEAEPGADVEVADLAGGGLGAARGRFVGGMTGCATSVAISGASRRKNESVLDLRFVEATK